MGKYAFQYKYENPFNKCSWKKLPGAAGISYEYDNEACLIFSQDGVQAANNKYTYYKYDAFYRVIEQGECTGKNNSNNAVVHLKNYYDDYSFVNALNDNVFKAEGEYCKGKLTGTEVTVLGSTSRLYTAFYYDGRGREIKRVQHNIFGGHEVTETTYTHTDKPSKVTHTHTASGKTTRTEEMTYTYDERDRLSKVTHKLGSNAAVTLASYTYDNLGRMVSKKLHGSQTQSYTYNIRSWLTGISSNKFTQNLTYNNGTSGYFNGNISSMNWTANGASHGYSFTYDGANRMLNATHGNNYFTEKVTGYDKNGNILSLQRYGQTGAGSYGLVDNLTYTLNGNQLTKVEDATTATSYSGGTNFVNGSTATTEYAYDANGNLTKDLNKNISSITYNSLNLPQVVTFGNGSTITYYYAADGTKVRTVHVINGTTTQTDYCGNVIYENGVQKLLLTEEGYVDLTNSTYHYYLKDHQGNNRVVINSNGTVKETNHYYPFGGLFAGTSVQPFKYNGKEFDSKNGLNWYDYGARHYDATLGRWHVVDPLVEEMPTWSPYTYCFNNPMTFIDEDGEAPKVLKSVYNIGKRAHKAYKKSGNFDLKQAVKGELLDLAENVKTLFDDDSSTAEKALAIFDLVTGFGDEAKAVSKTLGIVDDAADAGKTAKKTDAVSSSSKSESKPKSVNQLQKEVEKGKAPKGINRFDSPHDSKTGQPHVHFNDSKGSALNKDGSWKEGYYDLNRKEKDYLRTHGWNIE